MKFKKILITWFTESQLDNIYWERLRAISEEIIFMSDDEIMGDISWVECLLVKFNGASASIINFLPDLKYIWTIATGYWKIDNSFASKKGIVITNVPWYSTDSVAEFSFAVLLENLRDLSRAKLQAVDGGYDESWFSASEIAWKSFGVIGAGKIGTRVLEIAQWFSAKTSYWNRTEIDLSFESKGIDSLLQDSDIISVHLALNSETENFFSKEKISKITSGTIIINTAPMEIFDIEALKNRLEKNDITFIWDHPDEMNPDDLEALKKYSNCITYPPIWYITNEARINQQEIFVSNIEKFLEGGVTNKVN